MSGGDEGHSPELMMPLMCKLMPASEMSGRPEAVIVTSLPWQYD